MAAANRSTTDTPTTGPMTTSMTLGGIRMPRVPPAVIIPADMRTSYLHLFIVGAAITPRITTDAPTIPVAVAKIAAVNATAK